jgi:N6-adenosine-specific RNA methylase IME4
MTDILLNLDEENALRAHEATIERGLKTFVEVGNSLMAIRDAYLYRAEYATFEDYCRERWGISDRHANRLIQSAGVMANLGPMGPKPMGERQARPLTALTPVEQPIVWQRAVDTAPNGRLTESHIAATVRDYQQERRMEAAPSPAAPTGKYAAIVIDPPWPVQKIVREERPNQHESLDYPVMSLEEIAALPVPALADDIGCHLYLWVTHKFLPAGLQLVEAWGFRYQCLMTWVKPTGMTPYSWMYNTEHVIFARRGSLDLARMGLKLSFEAPVTRHSEKPQIFYDRVVAASPGPRLEMFARSPREGFFVWGNEVAHG